MSKARSPREVCSTTMGTRGLIGAPCVQVSGGASAGIARSPERRLRLALVSLLLGCPDPLSGFGQLGCDGGRELDGTIERELEAQVLARIFLGGRAQHLLQDLIDIFDPFRD